MIFIAALLLNVAQAADLPCANDLDGARKLLGEKHKALTWIETTENDQKPLYIQLSASADQKLHLEFFKTREGPWASGPATLCPKDDRSQLEAKVEKKQLVLGDTIPFFIKLGFGGGADFSIQLRNDDGSLKISTFGWSGVFIPSAEQALADARAQLEKAKNENK